MQHGLITLPLVELSELVNVKSKKLNSWITAVMSGHSIGTKDMESSDEMQHDIANESE